MLGDYFIYFNVVFFLCFKLSSEYDTRQIKFIEQEYNYEAIFNLAARK